MYKLISPSNSQNFIPTKPNQDFLCEAKKPGGKQCGNKASKLVGLLRVCSDCFKEIYRKK